MSTVKKPYLIESIKILENKVYNLDFHQARIARAMESIYESSATIDFNPILQAAQDLDRNLYKLRIVYNDTYLKYEFQPYTLKPIKTLQLISSNKIAYSHKFLDRTHLEKLYKLKRAADDILIVKNGMVTDTYYCNIALLKEGQWVTPKTPLLKGTKREQLLNGHQITEAIVYKEDLMQYERIRLFNAMIEFGDIDLDVKQII